MCLEQFCNIAQLSHLLSPRGFQPQKTQEKVGARWCTPFIRPLSQAEVEVEDIWVSQKPDLAVQ